MFSRRTLPVVIGICLLAGMFLAGQDTWPPSPECVVDADCGGAGRFCHNGRCYADCELCLERVGLATNCDDACRAIGTSGGTCAFPGSTNPERCCSCSTAACDFPPGAIADRGVAVNRRPWYNYGPSVMLEDDRYRMWWCGRDSTRPHEIIDVIYYSESTSGLNWTNPVRVLTVDGGPHQGIYACDPTVVKASNNYYYMFFTSEWPGTHVVGGTDNQVFLAWSPNGVNWDHANGGRPVIPIGEPAGTYGIGQSSVIFLDGGFEQFFTDTRSGRHNIYVARSTDGGVTFSLRNGGNPVLQDVTAVDAKYVPGYDLFLVAVEGPPVQWKISFYLLDRNYRVVAHRDPGADRWPSTHNHNPGLLGDPSGFIVNPEIIPLFFGSGSADHSTWDIRRADFYGAGILDPSCRQ